MKLGWRLKRPAYFAALAILLLVSAPPAFAVELIVIEKPFIARGLSGVVVDSTGAPVRGAVVEECEPPSSSDEAKNSRGEPAGEVFHGDCTLAPSRILASTETGAQGYFSLPTAKTRRIHYLHVSAPGLDPMQITVKLKHFARAGVRIQLHVAT